MVRPPQTEIDQQDIRHGWAHGLAIQPPTSAQIELIAACLRKHGSPDELAIEYGEACFHIARQALLAREVAKRASIAAVRARASAAGKQLARIEEALNPRGEQNRLYAATVAALAIAGESEGKGGRNLQSLPGGKADGELRAILDGMERLRLMLRCVEDEHRQPRRRPIAEVERQAALEIGARYQVATGKSFNSYTTDPDGALGGGFSELLLEVAEAVGQPKMFTDHTIKATVTAANKRRRIRAG